MTKDPKKLIIAAVAAAVVVAAILIGVSLSGGSGGTSNLTAAAKTASALDDIPQQGAVLGKPSAPVEITEFADLQCPFCAQADTGVMLRAVDRFVRPGIARIRFAPIAFIGQDSVRGALAALAAGRQGRLWQFIEVAYRTQGQENSGWLSDARVVDMARAVGLDTTRLRADMASAAVAAQRVTADQEARTAAVSSTPTFVVRGPGGQRTLVGVPTDAALAGAITAVR